MKLAYGTYLAVGVVILAVTFTLSQRLARSETIPASPVRAAAAVDREAEDVAPPQVDAKADPLGSAFLAGDLLAMGGLDTGMLLCELSEYTLMSGHTSSLRLPAVHPYEPGDRTMTSYSSVATVPEPMTLSLLCVGATALLWRRKPKT